MDQQAIREDLAQKLDRLKASGFEALALEVFHYQARHNSVYAEYIALLGLEPDRIQRLDQVPFLPIQLFKTHRIQTGEWTPGRQFTSSGTTGETTSRHLLRDDHWYQVNCERCFSSFYGPVDSFCFLALLPAYLEREGSSLVYMADHFIKRSAFLQSGFFLYDWNNLTRVLAECQSRKIPTVLLGVSFALLDLAEKFPISIPDILIMETGGMKGRRRELTREELHARLQEAFGVPAIHSEYGMTELFSQAYSQGEGRYRPGPLLRVFAREITDPLSPQQSGRLGVLNLIDLANLDTCSFIATDDLGKVYPDGSFEVLGRLDNSDIRGCNLLVA
ncbi:MAG: acyl transferase [Lewinellaceae bacterium]|nr:acyl transferase [Lewinellaceae bacterium]